ncbi:hypothetical protein ACTA71_001139 [Dictyostelium dimigraforme]
MEFLQIWLLIVGVYRLTMATLMFFKKKSFVIKTLYSLEPKNVSDLTARILFLCNFNYIGVFGNSILTISTALNYENNGLFYLTWFSFVIGLAHYLSEFLYFKTNNFKNNISQLIFAGPAVFFMSIRILYMN